MEGNEREEEEEDGSAKRLGVSDEVAEKEEKSMRPITLLSPHLLRLEERRRRGMKIGGERGGGRGSQQRRQYQKASRA